MSNYLDVTFGGRSPVSVGRADQLTFVSIS